MWGLNLMEYNTCLECACNVGWLFIIVFGYNV